MGSRNRLHPGLPDPAPILGSSVSAFSISAPARSSPVQESAQQRAGSVQPPQRPLPALTPVGAEVSHGGKPARHRRQGQENPGEGSGGCGMRDTGEPTPPLGLCFHGPECSWLNECERLSFPVTQSSQSNLTYRRVFNSITWKIIRWHVRDELCRSDPRPSKDLLPNMGWDQHLIRLGPGR